MVVLLHIFSRFWQWNNFENRLIFDEGKAYQNNCAIFWATLCGFVEVHGACCYATYMSHDLRPSVMHFQLSEIM